MVKHNSSALVHELFWVCLTILRGWRLKGYHWTSYAHCFLVFIFSLKHLLNKYYKTIIKLFFFKDDAFAPSCCSFLTSFLLLQGWTLPCILLKNGQTIFKKLTVFAPQDLCSMFGHFSTLCMKGLTWEVALRSSY